jgi:hypothetical protein
MVLGLALTAPAATLGATIGTRHPPGAQHTSTDSHPDLASALTTRAWQAASAPGAAHGLAFGALDAPATAAPTVYTRRVCVSRANVRSGPGTAYRVVGTLGRGASVKGPVSKGWLKIRGGQWISTTVICAQAAGAAPRAAARPSSPQTFQAWARALDPTGSATWTMDYARAHTRGAVRGLTVFHSWGQSRSTVYIQPGMGWAKTKMVMAHEAIHVRQVRYGGLRHSLQVFGSMPGLERAADCGATLTLNYVVRGGCTAALKPHVRNLLSGRAA